MMGPRILENVQSAATPMTPAPKNRRSVRKMVSAASCADSVAGDAAVRIGTKMPQPMRMPTNIAMPTERPTKCPTPTKRHGQAGRYTGRACAHAEVDGGLVDREARLAQGKKHGGCDGIDRDREQPLAALPVPLARLSADQEHFGCGPSFRIRQVAVDDQGAPQRHGKHDAENAAQSGGRHGHPIRKTVPPADDDQARKNEDDCRQRSGGARHGLNDIVLKNARRFEQSQHRHRDHRRRDRGGEGEPDLEPEVHIGRGEGDGDQPAEEYRAESQFRQTPIVRRAQHRRLSITARCP